MHIQLNNWEDVLYSYIKKFSEKERIIEDCRNDFKKRIKKVYKDNNPLFYCHSELHIVKEFVNNKYKEQCYIGISKLCCYKRTTQ